jgi:hypothetical protein
MVRGSGPRTIHAESRADGGLDDEPLGERLAGTRQTIRFLGSERNLAREQSDENNGLKCSFIQKTRCRHCAYGHQRRNDCAFQPMLMRRGMRD